MGGILLLRMSPNYRSTTCTGTPMMLYSFLHTVMTLCLVVPFAAFFFAIWLTGDTSWNLGPMLALIWITGGISLWYVFRLVSLMYSC